MHNINSDKQARAKPGQAQTVLILFFSWPADYTTGFEQKYYCRAHLKTQFQLKFGAELVILPAHPTTNLGKYSLKSQ